MIIMFKMKPEDIYIDKYGKNEKGHKLWEGIIYKGNACLRM